MCVESTTMGRPHSAYTLNPLGRHCHGLCLAVRARRQAREIVEQVFAHLLLVLGDRLQIDQKRASFQMDASGSRQIKVQLINRLGTACRAPTIQYSSHGYLSDSNPMGWDSVAQGKERLR